MKPLTLRQVAKAGYGLEMIQPTAIARVCAAMFGRRITPIPHFVRREA